MHVLVMLVKVEYINPCLDGSVFNSTIQNQMYVVISTPMSHIDMGTKPDNYIMFCVGVIISTSMQQIDMSLYACADDVGKNTVYFMKPCLDSPV